MFMIFEYMNHTIFQRLSSRKKEQNANSLSSTWATCTMDVLVTTTSDLGVRLLLTTIWTSSLVNANVSAIGDPRKGPRKLSNLRRPVMTGGVNMMVREQCVLQSTAKYLQKFKKEWKGSKKWEEEARAYSRPGNITSGNFSIGGNSKAALMYTFGKPLALAEFLGEGTLKPAPPVSRHQPTNTIMSEFIFERRCYHLTAFCRLVHFALSMSIPQQSNWTF